MAKNEAQTDIDLFNYLTNDKVFAENWKTKKIINTWQLPSFNLNTNSST
jgi:hypothetical protein